MLLFIGSEIMLFGSFFAAYFFIRVVNPGASDEFWPPWAPPVGGECTGVVRVPGLRRRGQHVHPRDLEFHDALGAAVDQARGARRLPGGHGADVRHGARVPCTQVIEYLNVGFNTGDGAFASVFFGLTGLHGAHVAIGLSLLLMVTIRGFRGHYSPEHHHGVELPGIYWHFVDVMWIVVYTSVYLL